MGKDRIDSIIDREAISAEVEATKKEISSLVQLIQSVKGKAVKISGAKSISEYTELKKQLDVLIKQTDLSAKATLADAKAREINAKAAVNEAKAVNEAAKAKKTETQATEASTRAKSNEQKLLDQAIDDYYQLSKAYDEAARKAQNYVLRLGENHPIAQQAVKDANDISNVLKNVDAAVGKFQRNVGNYKSAFDGLGFSFTQVARELPSLAINVQTFALAISNNLPIVIDELGKAKREIAALRAEGQQTPGLFARVAKSIFSFQTAVSVGITLVTVFAKELFGSGDAAEKAAKKQEKLTTAIKDQTNALKDFLESNAEVTNAKIKLLSNEKNQAAALGKETITFDKQIAEEKVKIAQETLKDAAKNGLAGLISLKDAENAIKKRQQQALEDYKTAKFAELQNTTYFLKNKKKYYKDEADLEKQRGDAAKTQYDFYTVLLNNLSEAQSEVIEIDNKAQQEALQKTIANIEALKDLNKFRLQVGTDLKILELKRIVDFNKQIADQESKSALDKVASLQRNVKDIKEIEYISEADRLSALRKSKDAELEIVLLTSASKKKAIAIELNSELAKNKLLSEDKRKTTTEIKALEEKAALEIKAIEQDTFDVVIRLNKEFNENRVKIQDEIKKRLIDSEQKTQTELEKVLAEGYANFKKKDDDRLKQTEEIAKQRLAILTDAADKERDLYKELYDELSGVVTDFFDAQDERRLQELDRESEAVDERTKRDIDFINQTVTNRQEAAARISIVEAQALAEKQEIENKKTEIERNSANIERLAKLAEIGGNTASSIFDLEAKAASARATAALLAANPATAAFAPNALLQASLISGQIPFVLAKAALQLVRLAIPRFAEGGVHDGGLMMVGDGGRHEGIQLPDGTVIKSPNTPTVMAAPPGTIIHKDYDKLLIGTNATGVPVFPQKAVSDTSTPKLMAGLKDIEKAVKNIKQPAIHVENLISKKIRGNNYLNKY